MRGRRAFAVVTVYLVLLSVFAWGIYQLQREMAESRMGFGFDPSGGGVALSATVGQAIFSGLLVLETLLILVLAPAFTTGAISLEREKQTLELLVATPLSSLAMVLGKLFSALVYVILLILASIPLATIVFTFGGVGPEDLVKAYVFLFAVAFGAGAIGLFFSALLRRTQVATVATYLTTLALTLGATVLYVFWFAMAQGNTQGQGFIADQPRGTPPEGLLWLNPFIGDLDLMCATAIGGYSEACSAVNFITGEAANNGGGVVVQDGGFVQGDVVAEEGLAMPRPLPADCPPDAKCAVFDDIAVGPVQPQAFGQKTDLFWPSSALAFGTVGVLLSFLSSLLVSPTRRPLRGIRRRDRPVASWGPVVTAQDPALEAPLPPPAPPALPSSAAQTSPGVDEPALEPPR